MGLGAEVRGRLLTSGPGLSPPAPDLGPQACVPLPPTLGGCPSPLAQGAATFAAWHFPGSEVTAAPATPSL